MLDIRIAVIICVMINTAECATCDECTTTYETARDAGGATNAQKCTALKTYLTCLESASGAGCPLITAKAGAIGTDHTTIASDCSLSDACTCQKTYWGTDVKAGDTAKCTAAKARITCLRGKTGAACDGTSTVSSLGTTTENIIGGITGGACTLTGACTCELAYVKADVSNDDMKCTAGKDFISCLVGKADSSDCGGSATVTSLATPVDTTISGISTCTKTDVCVCEITYAKANISTNVKRCTATKALTTCTQASIAAGCGASATKTTVGTAAQTVITDLASDCTLSDTCTCQVNFNKASVTDADKCTSANTFIECLNNITSTTDNACDGSTLTSALKTDLTAKVQSALCSTAGPKIEGSLLVSLLMLITSVLVISP